MCARQKFMIRVLVFIVKLDEDLTDSAALARVQVGLIDKAQNAC